METRKMKSEVLEKSGKRVVFLGNEAIARGALEAGVGLVATYPGTPSSEVPMVLSGLAKDLGFYFEYSVNEKIALETAAGAAWSGVRSLVTMKHFGLNVASDSLIPIAYTGVKAGLVVFVADDPSGWCSTQSEQDSRYYARLANLPMLEPSNPQECLEMTKMAFELSEEFEIPVLLRTTTKVSHSIGTVVLGELAKTKSRGHFKKDRQRFYNFRPQLQEQHQKLNEKIRQLENSTGSVLQELNSCKVANGTFPGDGEIGIITSGVSFEYVKEAAHKLGLKPPIAKLGLTYPLSEKFIANFIKDKKAVLVVEELESIIEDFVTHVAKDCNPHLEIHSKDILPRVGEYNTESAILALQQVFRDIEQTRVVATSQVCHTEKTVADLPPRQPVMCPGCPHRSTFYAVKKVFGPETIYIGDIGCAMLGSFEPFKMQDVIISMGAGIGVAHGISRVSDQEVVAFIGDSTFFHAGMPALLNHRFNNEKSPLVIVMDNQTTAMTGHQPNPGSVVKIEEIAKALGAEVRVANAFSQKNLTAALEELKGLKGSRVLVSRGECRLLTKRKMRQKGQALQNFEVVDFKEFEKSKLMDEFACPAFQKVNGKYQIDSNICWGCTVCSQICPVGIRRSNP
jgi:indolepyruvate ferredoxin oxidoreductase alpha subunit